VRLGRLWVGEDNSCEEDWEVLSKAYGAEEDGRESEAALLVLPLMLAA
jgi:hypothetical protein